MVGCGDPPVPRNLTIEMTGEGFQWHLRYLDAERLFGARGDVLALRHPHVPIGTRVRLLLRSEDYVYLFILAGHKPNHIAMPGRTFTLEFDATRPGPLQFSSGPSCGVVHPELDGEIVVERSRDFIAWLARQRTVPPRNSSYKPDNGGNDVSQ